jgi:hypothetical protein
MRLVKATLMLALAAFLASCASTATIPTQHFGEYSVTPPEGASQTKSNVTIAVEVLKPSESLKHPELFAFDIEQFPDSHFNFSTMGMFPKDTQGRRWLYTFGFGDKYLAALKVKLTNNTPHILRMKDARIYMVIAGESPTAAVTALGNGSLLNVGSSEKALYLPKSFLDKDGSLIHWLTQYENEWNLTRKKGLVSLGSYPVGFAAQVVEQNKKNYKLINDLAVEILPNFAYEGILLFPVVVSFDEVKLAFYDITTKTDAAGNALEKTAFEFPLKLEQVDMWYDKAAKQWKKGLPPTPAAAK